MSANPLRRQLPVYAPLPLGAIISAVRKGILSGALGRERVRQSLRRLLQERYEANAVALFASGTHALTAAIRMARGDDTEAVAIPAFTCYDVATATIGAGAPLLLYDIDPETLGPDWQSLERALEDGAAVVVASPLYGVPIDWDRLEELAGRYGAVLIEDAAQGAGASWHGRRLGSLGDISVLSFGRGKGWTGGGGGALLVRGPWSDRLHDPPRPPRRMEVRSAVAAAVQWLLGRPSIYGIPATIPWLHLGETRYKEPAPVQGMGNFAAALILATVRQADEEADTRREVAGQLRRELDSLPGLHLSAPPGESVAGYLRLPCRILDATLRTALLTRGRRSGIETSYPTSLTELPPVRDRLVAGRTAPGADILASQLVTLPTHSRLARRDMEFLTRGG